MHPLLASPRRLVIYLIAWEPFLVLVDGFLRGAGMHGWQRVALSGAMTVVFAFLALSAWYACWSAPLATSSPWRILRVQVGWGAVSTLIWLAIGYLANLAGVSMGSPAVIVAHYTAAAPMLFTMGLVAFLLSASVHYLVIALNQARAAERRALELQVVARDAELKTLRAELRMNAYASHGGVDQRAFELFALAASIVGKCEFCIASHYRLLKDAGVTTQELRDVGRIAAAVNAAAQVLAIEGEHPATLRAAA